MNTEVVEIGNQYKSDTLYVLSKSSANPKGVITLPSMGIDVGPYPVTKLSDPGHTFNSLTQKFTGNHIDISGHDNSNNFHLFDQYIYSPSLPTCFISDVRQYVPILGNVASSKYLTWGFSKEEGFEWKTAEIFDILIGPIVVCEECD